TGATAASSGGGRLSTRAADDRRLRLRSGRRDLCWRFRAAASAAGTGTASPASSSTTPTGASDRITPHVPLNPIHARARRCGDRANDLAVLENLELRLRHVVLRPERQRGATLRIRAAELTSGHASHGLGVVLPLHRRARIEELHGRARRRRELLERRDVVRDPD